MVEYISVEFPGHVSKSDLSALVVELIEHILFMRGQFPFRFEEGKKYVKDLQREHQKFKDGFEIYRDSPFRKTEGKGVAGVKENQHFQKISPQLKKAEKQLIHSVQSFENYLTKLNNLLCNHEVRELVLNFGRNFQMPKELFHIKLPGRCFYNDCREKTLPYQKCKSYLFKKYYENQVNCKDLPTEDLFPVSVMLRTLGMTITDDMEQKPFYSVPERRKSCVIELDFKCKHLCTGVTKPLENTNSDSENTCKRTLGEETSSDVQSDLWVQLMPVLKGFKDNFTPECSIVL